MFFLNTGDNLNLKIIRILGICYDNMCLLGSMGLTGRAVIQLAILPKYFHDLDEVERKKFTTHTPEEYNKFMEKFPRRFS